MSKYVTVLDLTKKLKNSRYVVVGDIHGCSNELYQLLEKVEFDYEQDYLICVGDLVDRGEHSPEVVSFFMDHPNCYNVMGNHDHRFIRYLKGNPVKISHGLDKTIEQFEYYNWFAGTEIGGKKGILEYFEKMPYIIKVPIDNMLFDSVGYVVHAGFTPSRPPEEQYSQDCLFMRYYGGKDYFDNVNGTYWFKWLRGEYPDTFSGHEVHEDWINEREYEHFYGHDGAGECSITLGRNDCLLDGGCVFGGQLRCWDSKTQKLYFVNAEREYSTKSFDKEKHLERSRESYKEIENG